MIITVSENKKVNVKLSEENIYKVVVESLLGLIEGSPNDIGKGAHGTTVVFSEEDYYYGSGSYRTYERLATELDKAVFLILQKLKEKQ